MNKSLYNLTPKEIVKYFDRYIVGQFEAKKTLAIAFRNRWRKQQLSDEIRYEIIPKNILMVGPTGVGKTELARRLAKGANAPFIKVEATKFTEIGYVGRDVDSIIRDLMEISISMIKTSLKKDIYSKAHQNAKNKILDILVGDNATVETREKFEKKLDAGKIDDKEIEIKVAQNQHTMTNLDIPGMPGSQMGIINIGDLIGKSLGIGNKTILKKFTIASALKALISEESDKLLDEDKVIKDAIELIENDGIVFIDEIDKIVAKSEARGGEVSREGVQRDLLPLIEGTTVSTKYGSVKTDHILFIASGAFHVSKPADLLPELQGRLPIRVELKALTQEDMIRILKEPEVNLIKQYQALLLTENINLNFSEEGINTIAAIATKINREVENIGARRLHTVMEKLLENISFETGSENLIDIDIDERYVQEQIGDLVKEIDLSKFIL